MKFCVQFVIHLVLFSSYKSHKLIGFLNKLYVQYEWIFFSIETLPEQLCMLPCAIAFTTTQRYTN